MTDLMTDGFLAVLTERAAIVARGLDTCLTMASEPTLAAEQRGRALTQALNLAKELALEMSQIHRRRAELMEPADG